MRNLTIKREKAFAASAIPQLVYVEDPTHPELTIRQVPCRLIGLIRNGETKTFEIGNEACRIFVIADKRTCNFSNGFLALPAGEEDLFFTGVCELTATNGTPFRFMSDPESELPKLRKKSRRAMIVTYLIFFCLSVAVGVAVALFK